jgi:hypothetical protein
MLAKAVDGVMGAIAGTLDFRFSQDLYEPWKNILIVANIMFAIAFLIMIYSQATGVGLLSNYTIKKMMPRLVIVAVGVNISFYACAAMADLASIAGGGMNNLLFSATDPCGTSFETRQDPNLVGIPNDKGVCSYQNTNEEWLKQGGGTGTGFIQDLISGGVLFFIILINYGAILLGVIAILLALAARMIVLALLIIISPLAIVASLLPNTKKWFDKWLNTYVQMLIVYPVFMLGWSAVRLIQSLWDTVTPSGGAANFVTTLIGLLLPLAPLFVIMPLLRSSGGLMGKMMGAIEKSVNNNPLANRIKDLNKETNARIASNASAWGTRLTKRGKEREEGIQNDANRVSRWDKHLKDTEDLTKKYRDPSNRMTLAEFRQKQADLDRNFEDELRAHGSSMRDEGIFYGNNSHRDFYEEQKENRQQNRSRAGRAFGGISRFVTGETFKQWQEAGEYGRKRSERQRFADKYADSADAAAKGVGAANRDFAAALQGYAANVDINLSSESAKAAGDLIGRAVTKRMQLTGVSKIDALNQEFNNTAKTNETMMEAFVGQYANMGSKGIDEFIERYNEFRTGDDSFNTKTEGIIAREVAGTHRAAFEKVRNDFVAYASASAGEREHQSLDQFRNNNVGVVMNMSAEVAATQSNKMVEWMKDQDGFNDIKTAILRSQNARAAVKKDSLWRTEYGI